MAKQQLQPESIFRDLDLHLFAEGKHERIFELLGAHLREMPVRNRTRRPEEGRVNRSPGAVSEPASGVSFAVWAPNARSVRVVGDFNEWDGNAHPMRPVKDSGIWERFVPGVKPGARYKYEIHPREGTYYLKADPYAFEAEQPPATASIVHEPSYEWKDQEWLETRAASDPLHSPISIYEIHLGSWRPSPSYRDIAPLLRDYLLEMGFTHVELMPVAEHPFTGSWGYQPSGYYAPTSRYGTPDDFRFFVDTLHQAGIGVIVDWVPAHFPKDNFSLGRFDGTALYEHQDPRMGEHPDWGTFIFNYGRNEVRNFLLANALYWLDEFHIDGLRLDAVASMLYLDYSRKGGEWLPNKYGGRENLEAIGFLKELNARAYAGRPGILMVAEESTAWPQVSRPTDHGGLGFGFKWNMGWMNDTLRYCGEDPVSRRHHHHLLTFSAVYAWTENFMLPLSHDEVVHGKRSLVDKFPGEGTEKMAQLRALFGYMWAHPGKNLLFMGGEIAQWKEWSHEESLPWNLLEYPDHRGVQQLVKDLNRMYRENPALWKTDDDPAGFLWADVHNADENVFTFLRLSPRLNRQIVCVVNFSGVDRDGYRLPLPRPGVYREILNTDSSRYHGRDRGNLGQVEAELVERNGFPYSAPITLPRFSTLWFDAPQ